MAPEAVEFEDTERLQAGASGRVGPLGPGLSPPARAWAETERLLPSPGSPTPAGVHAHSSRMKAGLILGVWNHQKKTTKYLDTKKTTKLVIKKLPKRKEKIYAEFKLPLFILTIIFILILVHATKSRWLESKLDWSPRVWRWQPWRLFTYSVMHGDNTHLALNAIVAIAVGWCLEREQKWWRVMILWGGGVVAGALGAGALQPTVHVVGASAAVYALLTGHIANVCLRYGHIPLWWFRPMSVLVIVASEGLWALLYVPLSGSYIPLHTTPATSALSPHLKVASGPMDHIAWSSHVLGAAVGIPLAFLVFTGENSSMVRLKICRVVSAVLLSVVFVILSLKNTVWV